jgi:hypothetical protein
MAFIWDDQKNRILRERRGIGFERIVIAIEEGHLLTVLEHPNKIKYSSQLVLVLEIDNYAFCVPCVPQSGGNFFLKTIFPSRKYSKQFNLKGGKRNE